ncbi:MAG: hypothetical protein CMJ78_23855 [Planctomycetaceae bacterium]|nr:hypothetical protein [Planctomycetaceae bacterium]
MLSRSYYDTSDAIIKGAFSWLLWQGEMSGFQRKRNAFLVYAALVFVVAGFWMQTSNEPVFLGKYSFEYAMKAAAISLTATFLTISAHMLLTAKMSRRDDSQQQARQSVRVLAVVALLVVTYSLCEFVMTSVHRGDVAAEKQARRERLDTFHPFLQVSAASNDEAMHINRWGFRGEDIEKDKPEGTYRVFVLGGSTVYCSRAKFEDSHCRRLEVLLRSAYPARRIEVQNAGYDWHTSQHSLMKFLFEIQDFDPDLIIVMHAINDICRSFSPPRYSSLGEFQPDYSHFHGPLAEMLKQYAVEDQPPRSWVWHHTVKLFQDHWYADFRVGPNVRRDQEWRRFHSEGKTVDANLLPSLATYQRNMQQLIEVVRSKQIDMMISSQPSLYKESMSIEELTSLTFPMNVCRNEFENPDIQSLVNAMKRFNAASAELAQENDVGYVTLAKEMPKTLDYFVDDVHYTKKGNEFVAEQFFRKIQAAGFLQEDAED